jgi:hypothetical protein
MWRRGEAVADKPNPVGEAKDELEGSFWDKFKHPVFGALLTAWIVINWKIFYLLLCGRNDYQTVICLLETQVITWSNWWHLILEPLLSTAAYLYAAPRFKAWYINHVRRVELRAENLHPIPRQEKTALEEALKVLTEERNALSNAYGTMRFSDDKEGTLLSLAKEVNTYKRQWENAANELTLLRGDKAIKDSERIEALTIENKRLVAEVGRVREVGNLIEGTLGNFVPVYEDIRVSRVLNNSEQQLNRLKEVCATLIEELKKISITYQTRVVSGENDVIP